MNASEWMDSTARLAPLTLDGPVNCPLCGADAQTVITATARRGLHRCPECSVAFVFPQLAAAAVAERFRDEALPHFDPEHNREHVLQRIASYIQAFKGSGTILDVGCATGYFLSHFFPENKWRRLGVELLESSARAAEDRGLVVYRGGVRDVEIDDASVDVLTVLEAFYYFPQPQSELAQFRRILKPDGLLVLEMPVATSRILRLSRVAGKRVSGVAGTLFEESDHLYYHTPQSISRLLENNGFQVMETVMLPANRQNGWLRERLYRMYWLVSQALRLFTSGRVFLGPRFLIAARKRTAPAVLDISDHR